MPHRVALWLYSAVLGLRDNAKADLFYLHMVGHERMGVALDKVLAKIKSDSPRPASVHAPQLRVQLREAGKTLRDENDEDLLADTADLYTIAVAADFSTGAGIDDIYSTNRCWTAN